MLLLLLFLFIQVTFFIFCRNTAVGDSLLQLQNAICWVGDRSTNSQRIHCYSGILIKPRLRIVRGKCSIWISGWYSHQIWSQQCTGCWCWSWSSGGKTQQASEQHLRIDILYQIKPKTELYTINGEVTTYVFEHCSFNQYLPYDSVWSRLFRSESWTIYDAYLRSPFILFLVLENMFKLYYYYWFSSKLSVLRVFHSMYAADVQT